MISYFFLKTSDTKRKSNHALESSLCIIGRSCSFSNRRFENGAFYGKHDCLWLMHVSIGRYNSSPMTI